MAQVSKITSDTEDWSKGNGEFFIASKSTVTNRQTKTYQYGGNSDSESRQFNVFRREDEAPYVTSSNNNNNINSSTAIHVDVRSPFPPVEIPIRQIATTGQNWASADEKKSNYESLAFSPPAPRAPGRSSRRRQTIRQGSETQVVTKLTIPPLASPAMGQPRHPQRSYSSDIIRETEMNTTNRQTRGMPNPTTQYTAPPVNSSLRHMNLRDPPSRSQTPGRRKKHHSCHCCHRRDTRPRGDSPSRYATYRGAPMPYAMPQAAPVAVCPGCTTPLFAPQYPAPYFASPAIPMNSTMPRFYAGPPTLGPMSATPGGFTQPMGRTPRQFHCICCPNGQHQNDTSKVFTFENDQWDSDGQRHTKPQRSSTKGMRQQHQYMQRMQESGSINVGGRRLGQTTAGFPLRETNDNGVQMRPSSQASPGSALNDNTYPSQRMHQSQFSARMSPRGSIAPGLHGEVTRDDGFPVDYVDLIEGGIEYSTGGEDSEDVEGLIPPDKKVVIQLAETALSTASTPPQVATTLKKAMDDNFGPVWHVVAGTGAYGSNIASLGGQLLHFKAFGWAFLIWKTSDQQME